MMIGSQIVWLFVCTKQKERRKDQVSQQTFISVSRDGDRISLPRAGQVEYSTLVSKRLTGPPLVRRADDRIILSSPLLPPRRGTLRTYPCLHAEFFMHV